MNDNTKTEKTKACSKCGVVKPSTTEFFHRCNRNKTGIRSICKVCANKYRNERKERLNAYNRDYHKVKREEVSKRKSDYYKANKEKINSYGRKYRLKNIGRIRKYKRRYKLKNREYFNVQERKRRSLKRSLPSTLTIQQWEKAKEMFSFKCAYCGRKEDLQQDHFYPMSKGGEYTKENIVPACISCNSSKNNSNFFEWYPRNKHFDYERKKFLLRYLGYESNKQQLSIL